MAVQPTYMRIKMIFLTKYKKLGNNQNKNDLFWFVMGATGVATKELLIKPPLQLLLHIFVGVNV